MEQEKRKVKIRTIVGKILTVDVKEQTDEYISGTDLFGYFVKIPLDQILESYPIKEEGQ